MSSTVELIDRALASDLLDTCQLWCCLPIENGLFASLPLSGDVLLPGRHASRELSLQPSQAPDAEPTQPESAAPYSHFYIRSILCGTLP